jgi:hypothetical protein
MIIHHHLGLGDHFVCNGLVNFISRHQTDTIDLICKKHNFPTVECLYSENDKINVVPLEFNGDEISKIDEYGKIQNKSILRIGFYYCDPTNWDKSFYKQVGIDFIERYRFFKLPKLQSGSLLPLPDKKFIFVHNQSSDGIFDLKIESNLDKILVKKEDTNNLLSYINLIENAEEIHCINSSLFHLIDSMSNITNKLYYHNIRKHPYNFQVSAKWSIIEYV